MLEQVNLLMVLDHGYSTKSVTQGKIMPVTKSRYRPAFSKEEVEVLHTILMDKYLSETNPAFVSEVFSSEETLIYNQLIGKINTLRSKIANDAINPAYIVSKHSDPAIATLESLGAPEEQIATLSGIETKEAYWERCYYKYRSDPSSCTIPELDAALEYRYLHDLMSGDEAIAFEAKPQKGVS